MMALIAEPHDFVSAGSLVLEMEVMKLSLSSKKRAGLKSQACNRSVLQIRLLGLDS